MLEAAAPRHDVAARPKQFHWGGAVQSRRTSIRISFHAVERVARMLIERHRAVRVRARRATRRDDHAHRQCMREPAPKSIAARWFDGFARKQRPDIAVYRRLDPGVRRRCCNRSKTPRLDGRSASKRSRREARYPRARVAKLQPPRRRHLYPPAKARRRPFGCLVRSAHDRAIPRTPFSRNRWPARSAAIALLRDSARTAYPRGLLSRRKVNKMKCLLR